MDLTSNFQLLADYNRWMNENVYKAAAQLNETDLKADRGAFFGSVFGTLSHILVGDTLWMKRFVVHLSPAVPFDYIVRLRTPVSLDEVVYEDLRDLHQSRVQMDEAIGEFASNLNEKSLSTTMSYVNTKGISSSKNFGALIQHFFNHQTHHRGQVSTLLNQVGVDVGVTDLMVRIPVAD